MEEREEIYYQFFQELIESYRLDILKQEKALKLAEEKRKLLERIEKEFGGLHSEEFKLVANLMGCMLDLGCVQQEQLYLQGVRDGIRLKKKIEEIEDGK